MMEKLLRDVEYNYNVINERISEAAQKVGKTREDIKFLAATKTVDVEVINYAISLGLNYIGENKVQELISKYDNYNLENCSLQFIGHLQSNKVRQIVGKVDLIQSVDSVKLAKEISRQSVNKNVNTDILVEVNIGREENKSGVLPEMAYELIDEIKDFDNMSVKVLMTIPPISDNSQEISEYFNKVNKLFIDISGKKLDNVSMDILSMGMTGDFEVAIEEGATMVRVGTGIFGKRNYQNT